MAEPPDGATIKIPGWLVPLGASMAGALLTGLIFSFTVGRSVGRDVVLNADLPEKIKYYSAYTQDKGKIDLTLETQTYEMREVKQSVGSLKEKTDNMAAKVDVILEQVKALTAARVSR